MRTARLVAAAVARRSGVDEAVLDEVRLAVGEACSRAVDLHRRFCPDRPGDGDPRSTTPDVFRVAVTDEAPSDARPRWSCSGSPSRLDFEGDTVPSGVVLAVISGLVDDVSVEHGGRGRASGGLRMSLARPRRP